jgi:heat shock protein HslJ
MRTPSITIVALALVLAACGDPGGTDRPGVDTEDTTTSTRPSDTTPDGSWILASGAPTVDGFPISLTLDGQQFSGRAACNQYGGTIVQSGSGWRLTEMFMTEMGCEPEVMNAEQAFITALRAVSTWSIVEGALTLEGPDEPLVFTRAPQVPTDALIGTTWILETILDGDVAATPIGDAATLLLDADGTVTGSTGCRDLSGTWIAADAQIFFPDFAADGECSQDVVDQDGIVVTVLGDGFRPTIEGDLLTITSMGDQGLVYRSG